jgi:Organic Anion Transporter Polypeptide (OATP) family
MATEGKPPFRGWLKSFGAVRGSDYRPFLVVFCYLTLFLGMPVVTLQFNQESIHREFGVRTTDVRLPLIMDSLGNFILAPFIVLLGQVKRRPLFICLALLSTGMAHILVLLAHQFTVPSSYITRNSETYGRLICDANSTDEEMPNIPESATEGTEI